MQNKINNQNDDNVVIAKHLYSIKLNQNGTNNLLSRLIHNIQTYKGIGRMMIMIIWQMWERSSCENVK